MMTVQERYLLTRVLTATPGQLIVIVYDEAIKSIKSAKESLANGDIQEVNRKLQKAQEAINLLKASLDYRAGEIGQNLAALYEFINGHLVTANLKKDARLMDEALSLLEGLRESWEQISHMSQSV